MDGETEEVEADTLAEQTRAVPRPLEVATGRTPHVQRQVFEASTSRSPTDKASRRVELSATVSEAVADAFENAKVLQVEGSSVVVDEIAGEGLSLIGDRIVFIESLVRPWLRRVGLRQLKLGSGRRQLRPAGAAELVLRRRACP